MMNLSKSYDFFKPEEHKERIHIVGCGSVGSTVAENLARCGITNMVLWDFDRVEAKNVANQMFRDEDVGKLKVDALEEIICSINPGAEKNIVKKPDGWKGEKMSGFIFMCVDSVDCRKQIIELHEYDMNVRAVFDFRTLLTGAQHYAADWTDYKMKENLKNSLDFTQEEAEASAPMSACGETLGVVTTVRLVSAMGVNNYINFVKGNGIWKFVNIDGFYGILDCFN